MLIVIIIAAIALLYAATRKGSTDMKKPNRIKSFTTNVPSDKAMKTIIQFAQTNGYKVDDFNDNASTIILSDSATLTNYGNIYPVYLVRQSNNSVQIDVGIKMKAGGLIGLDASHERCFNGIKSAIFAVS